MKKILIFGGTSEEHGLIRALADYPAALTLCVASDYGAQLAQGENRNLTVRSGRLDVTQMTALIRREGYCAVVDATHPYAEVATQNIRKAAADTGIPYLRLRREESDISGAVLVRSAYEAAELLKTQVGNVLLTTGSKLLEPFTAVPDYQERLYPRILPTVESVEACLSLRFKPGNIIAMQGPFSKELNVAMMKQFNIKTLVTKDGGRPGGFPEKLEAARELGAALIVIGRPAEDGEGLSLADIKSRIAALLEEQT